MAEEWLSKLTEAVKLDITSDTGSLAFRRLLRSAWSAAPTRTRPIIGKLQTMFRGRCQGKAESHAQVRKLVRKRRLSERRRQRLAKSAGKDDKTTASADDLPGDACTSESAPHASVALDSAALAATDAANDALTTEKDNESGQEEGNDADDAGGAEASAADGSAEAPAEARASKPRGRPPGRPRAGATKAEVKGEVRGPAAAIKKEPKGDGPEQPKTLKKDRPGFAKGISHYKHQIAIIEKFVPPPWKVCFGGMGTGIIGVRPQTGVDPEVKSESVKGEMGDLKVKQELAEDDEKPPGASAEADPIICMPSDATVFLLINAPTGAVQSRNGTTMGSYEESLDVERGTMRWSSQRKDRSNRMVMAIVAHCLRGGRVMVVARSNDGQSDGKTYKPLGEVSHIDEVSKNCFLVRDGDGILLERGNNLYHRQIGLACLNAGLKSGVGLTAVRYPLKKSEKQVKWCPACCFQTAHALLHFKELLPEGVDAYGGHVVMGSVDRADDAVVTGVRPAKRLRSKSTQALDGTGSTSQAAIDELPVRIKREMAEDLYA